MPRSTPNAPQLQHISHPGPWNLLLQEGPIYLRTAQGKDPVFFSFSGPVSSTVRSSRDSHGFVHLFLEGLQRTSLQMCVLRRPLLSKLQIYVTNSLLDIFPYMSQFNWNQTHGSELPFFQKDSKPQLPSLYPPRHMDPQFWGIVPPCSFVQPTFSIPKPHAGQRLIRWPLNCTPYLSTHPTLIHQNTLGPSHP